MMFDDMMRWQNQIRRNTLGDLLRRVAGRSPDKTAVYFGDEMRSYAQWNREVNRLAFGLTSIGICSGEHIGLVARNSLRFLTLVLALAKMGVVVVPVNPTLTKDEFMYIFRNAEISGVVSDAAIKDRVQAALPQQNSVQFKALLDGAAPGWLSWDQLFAEQEDEYWSDVDDNYIAQILYTSGTESRPKGVILTHRNLIDQFVSIIMAGEFRSDDVVLHALPLFHSAQLNAFFGPFLYLGATHVLTEKPEPSRVLDLIERYRVTQFFAPPTIWIGLLRSPQFQPKRLRSLTKAVYGAAIMPTQVLKELGSKMPWIRFWNMYGMTEMAPFATSLPPEEQLTRPLSVGKPGINVEMAVLDDDEREVKRGELGEIVLRSSHAMQGYYNNPERTHEAFRYGWYHTGDVGFIDSQGYLTVVDRKKDMIKSGGENIASREIEDVLYTHPAVLECAVLGLPHPYWIEAVTAVVVLRDEMTASAEELRDFCRARLAGYKVPKAFLFHTHLPKNASGKVLKAQLKSICERQVNWLE